MKKFNDILSEETETNTDKILLRSASKQVFDSAINAIENFITQTDVAEEVKKDKKWRKQRKESALLFIANELKKMKKNI